MFRGDFGAEPTILLGSQRGVDKNVIEGGRRQRLLSRRGIVGKRLS